MRITELSQRLFLRIVDGLPDYEIYKWTLVARRYRQWICDPSFWRILSGGNGPDYVQKSLYYWRRLYRHRIHQLPSSLHYQYYILKIPEIVDVCVLNLEKVIVFVLTTTTILIIADGRIGETHELSQPITFHPDRRQDAQLTPVIVNSVRHERGIYYLDETGHTWLLCPRRPKEIIRNQLGMYRMYADGGPPVSKGNDAQIQCRYEIQALEAELADSTTTGFTLVPYKYYSRIGGQNYLRRNTIVKRSLRLIDGIVSIKFGSSLVPEVSKLAIFSRSVDVIIVDSHLAFVHLCPPNIAVLRDGFEHPVYGQVYERKVTDDLYLVMFPRLLLRDMITIPNKQLLVYLDMTGKLQILYQHSFTNGQLASSNSELEAQLNLITEPVIQFSLVGKTLTPVVVGLDGLLAKDDKYQVDNLYDSQILTYTSFPRW